MMRQRLLERALLFTIVIHAVAMVSMALFLLPGMPGGGTSSDAARVDYVARHPWLWRLGWIPWGITALSDLLIGIALIRTPWIPRLPAWIALALTAVAVAPDQVGQIAWMTRGIDLARSGDVAAYLAYEARLFEWTAVWGAGLYTIGAVAWTVCFASAGTWNRALTLISAPLWALFAVISFGPLLPPHLRPSSAVVAVGNALGFVVMELWFALVAEEVLRRARPFTAHGRLAPWRHPSWFFRPLDLVANSRFARDAASLLPRVAFDSDITDVIYVNYLVSADRVARLVPEGLELQRIGPGSSHALVTFLTFRHGHFGPRMLGPLRRLLPSPVQTNWRIHVRDPRTGHAGIFFVTTAISSTLHAVAARLMAEGLPMHVLASARVGRDGFALDPGDGSAPDAVADLHPGPAPAAGPWSDCFPTWRDFLAYCVPQDRAMTTQPWAGTVTRQEIRLDIPINACEPLVGEVRSRAALALVGDAVPFSFRVAAVKFRFDREEQDALP